MILSNLIPEILHNYWAVSHDLNGAVFQLNRSFQRRIIRALNRRRYPDRRGKQKPGKFRISPSRAGMRTGIAPL